MQKDFEIGMLKAPAWFVNRFDDVSEPVDMSCEAMWRSRESKICLEQWVQDGNDDQSGED